MCDICKTATTFLVLTEKEEKYYILPGGGGPYYRKVNCWQQRNSVRPGQTVAHGNFVFEKGEWKSTGHYTQHLVPHQF
ncbi:MAG TPA: hypothetical protein V6C81_21740 [Planktothrix sp.]|jgi:hypothetical protein